MKRNLLNLLVSNANRPQAVRAETADGASRVVLNGVIDADYGVSAASLIQAMQGLGDFELHINSPGGDVFESTAMAIAIAAHPGKVTAVITGVAASAATRVALAAAKVRIADSGMFMIHNSWSITIGDKHDHTNRSDLLAKIDSTIAADYSRKTGKPEEEIASWMDAETWFTATEAKDAGFVDEIDSTTQAKAMWDLSAYKNPPKTEDLSNRIAETRAHNERRLRLLQIA